MKNDIHDPIGYYCENKIDFDFVENQKSLYFTF
jgi:CCR4-NOT transcriptional regulation complex NOT5 subunit